MMCAAFARRRRSDAPSRISESLERVYLDTTQARSHNGLGGTFRDAKAWRIDATRYPHFPLVTGTGGSEPTRESRRTGRFRVVEFLRRRRQSLGTVVDASIDANLRCGFRYAIGTNSSSLHVLRLCLERCDSTNAPIWIRTLPATSGADLDPPHRFCSRTAGQHEVHDPMDPFPPLHPRSPRRWRGRNE